MPNPKESACQHCNEALESLFVCSVCNQLQILKELPNYFDALGLEKQFMLNLTLLEDQYDDLMLLLHPDLFLSEKSEIVDLSLHYSAYLKEAKDKLTDDYSRAEYLYQTITGKILSDAELQPDQAFIIRMFEIQSTLEDQALTDNEKDELVNELNSIKNELNIRLEKIAVEQQPDNFLNNTISLIGKLKFLKNIVSTF